MENNGLSLSAIVFIVLLTLKLSDVIDWSWWWITLPLWWMIPMVLLILIFALIVVLFEELSKKIREQD
jgi:hypothetical protein